MINRPNRFIILLIVCLLFNTITVFPIQSIMAQADDSPFTALSTPVIYDQLEQALGRIKVQVPAGAIKEDDVMVVRLPYELNGGMSNTAYNEDDEPLGNYVFIPKQNNGLQKEDLQVTPLTKNEFKIIAKKQASYTNDVTFFIELNSVDIKKGVEGPVIISFDGPSHSGFPTGELVAGTVITKGQVELSADNVDSSNHHYSLTLRIKETIQQSLRNGQNSIKLKLPSGFKWNLPVEGEETTVYGDDLTISYAVYKNELSIHVDSNPSVNASMWLIPLSFSAEDEGRIIPGDIYAYISGTSKTDVDKIKVGTYEEYGATIVVDNELPTIISGKTNQGIAAITIKEKVPKSIIPGRTLSITLPENVKWVQDDTDQDGINLGTPRIQSNGRVLQYTVTGSSSNIANLELDQLQVAIRPGFTGDLDVTIEGAGINANTVTVAKVVKPVNIATTTVPNVIIGKSNQAMADITIAETVKEALQKDGTILVSLPRGVQFTEKPDVKVTAGNLFLKRVSMPNNYTLEIEIDAESTKPSTIAITNANVTIDRTVPEGSIEAEIGGTALIETTHSIQLNGTKVDLWKYDDILAKAIVANVTTPAPGNPIPDKIQFKIGEEVYVVNGQVKEMDVAPFIEKSRTYLPIRYVAISLGVDTDDILWDDKTRRVTILKGNRTVQLTIGSNTLLLNGMAVQMDVPAQIKNGRTQLPLRFVAEAFGSKVEFDEPTRTVTIQ